MGQAGATTKQNFAAFKIEKRGIEPIPDAERNMAPSGLFWLWAGAVLNVEFLFYGALIMTFGLSLGQAVLVVLVGNLFYAFLGWASLQGPEAGTTAFMVSRAAYGQNGNRSVAFFNWATLVGFEIEGVYLTVATVILLFSRYGTTLSSPAKVLVIVLASLIQLIVPLLGHPAITRIFRYLAYLFIAFFVVLAIFTIRRLHPNSFHQGPASWAVWTTALVLIISVGGLGWTPNGNDYSRYLPRNTPKSRTFWAATLGAGIPSVLLEILGLLAFTVTKKSVGIAQLPVPQTFPNWFVLPFLIFAIVQLFAINTIDLYSSGVTLQALGVPIKRWVAVLIDTIVCAIVTGIILFHGNFYADFAGFLLYILVWLAPWFGILMVDYLLRRQSYDPFSLAADRGGLYWRNNGVHWPGIIAQVIGMIATLMWTNAEFAVPSYVGPISNHLPGFHGGDIGWVLGILTGGLVYYLLCRRSVPAEVISFRSTGPPCE